jgi:ComEC/Rec2-related protein
VGDQKAINGDLWTTFNRTGTTHLMSISGLHVTMVAALFGWFVSFGWRRSPSLVLTLPAQKAGLLAACAAALFYSLLAGFAVPAQRTLIMMLVAGAAMLSGRIVAPSRILALALLIVLLYDPWAVLAAGFWLSFGAVGALLYAGRRGCRLARAAALVGRRPVGGDAGLLAYPVARLPAVFSGIAAGQRAGHPGRQLRRHAARPARCAGSVVADPGAGPPDHGLADAVPGMVRQLAGLAGPGTALVGRGRGRRRRGRLPVAARFAGALAGRAVDPASIVLADRPSGRRRGVGRRARRRAGAGQCRAHPKPRVDLRPRPALQRRIGCRAARGRALPALSRHRPGGHADGHPPGHRSFGWHGLGQGGAGGRRGPFIAARAGRPVVHRRPALGLGWRRLRGAASVDRGLCRYRHRPIICPAYCGSRLAADGC